MQTNSGAVVFSSLNSWLEQIAKLLEQQGFVELDKVDLTINQLKVLLQPKLLQSVQSFRNVSSVFEWKEFDSPLIPDYQSKPIEEITFKRSNGSIVKIGGDIVPPYYQFLQKNHQSLRNPNQPKVTYDVFDMKVTLPKNIKDIYKEVLDNPPAWAQMAEKFGADLITLHFVSTDPGIKDSSVSNATKILDEVLQSVKIPVIIGGSGNKKKDTELFEACAAMTQGEQLMLSSADKLTWDKVVPIAKKYGHNVLLWAQMDINDQTKLVEDALRIGMPRNRIVLDPTCATLGYGMEYSFSIYQRIRLAGLKGDPNLNFPMSAGTTNAWGAREAWMKELAHMPNNGGPRELRGPIWEIITALVLSLCGMNLAMMLHPYSAATFKQIIEELNTNMPKTLPKYLDWISNNL